MVSGQLQCRQCSTALHPADVDMDSLSARCRRCGWTVGQEPPSPGLDLPKWAEPDHSPLEMASGRQVPPMPKGIEVETTPGRFKISRSWWSPLRFALGLCGVPFVAIFVLSGGANDYPIVAAVFCVLALSVVGVSCAAIALNTMYIEVVGSALRLRHGPVPWPGVVLAVRELHQFFVAMVRSHRGNISSYQLRVQMRNGAQVVLLDGLLNPMHALYLEAVLEKQLGIVDRAMEDELPKRRTGEGAVN